jgi:hypothetical protein
MAKHIVMKRVHHDGKPYGKGAEIDLTKDQAAPLIASGHVIAPEKASK